YLGYAYYMSDHPGQAESCYQRIFKLDINNVSALHYLEILNHQEDPGSALDYSTRLTVLQPNKAAWWRTRGEIFRRLKHPDSALVSLSHAYSLAPEEAKNAAALSDLLIEDKNYTLADSILKAGLARDSMVFSLLKLRVRSAYLAKDYSAVLAPGLRI